MEGKLFRLPARRSLRFCPKPSVSTYNKKMQWKVIFIAISILLGLAPQKLIAACSGLTPKLAVICETLNKPDLLYSSGEYRKAVAEWPDNLSIWNTLDNEDSKARFAAYVIKREKPDRSVPGIDQSGPFADREVCYTFVCRQFARKRFYRYSSEVDSINSSDEYPVEKAVRKYQLPIREVVEVSDNSRVGHVLNAIRLDENDRSAKWIFFEPQTNDVLYSPTKAVARTDSAKQVAWVVMPADHGLSLDRSSDNAYETARRNPTKKHSLFSEMPSFVISRNNQLVPMPLPKLDGASSDVPANVNAAIVSHNKAEVARLIVTQHSSEARQAILSNVQLCNDWSGEEIASLGRYATFAEHMERTVVDGDYQYKIGRVIDGSWKRHKWEVEELITKPWLQPWLDFIGRENPRTTRLGRVMDFCARTLEFLGEDRH